MSSQLFLFDYVLICWASGLIPFLLALLWDYITYEEIRLIEIIKCFGLIFFFGPIAGALFLASLILDISNKLGLDRVSFRRKDKFYKDLRRK